MAKDKPERSYWVSRQAIGSLFKAVTLSTDPAHTLGFSSSLIGSARAALIQKLEDKIPDNEQLPIIFDGLLKAIIRGYGATEDEIQTIDQRIDAIFKSDAQARYGLEIFRDAIITENLHQRWKEANRIYIQSPAAWAISNDILSDVHLQLNEILFRHDLMQFPKGEVFNLDEQGSTYATLAKAMEKIQSGGG